MTNNIITSAITDRIITVVEQIGPITIDALRIVFPRRDLTRRIDKAWGYLDSVSLSGEPGVIPLQVSRGKYDAMQQQIAYAWYMARVLQAGMTIDDAGCVVYPQGPVSVCVAPEIPLNRPAVLVLPRIHDASISHGKGVYVVREVDLRQHDLRTALSAASSATV